MAVTVPFPAQVDFDADLRIARWRPLVQWLLVIPHVCIVSVLRSLRQVLTLVSFVTVLFTEQIPRPVFDMIAMSYRYEWRTLSYALFMHDDYPPFDCQPAAADDGVESHTKLSIAYPEHLGRWAPLYKWILAVPHYVVIAVLALASVFAFLAGAVAVVVTGAYPRGVRDFLVGVYRYTLRVEAYVGLLTDAYPPFTLAA